MTRERSSGGHRSTRRSALRRVGAVLAGTPLAGRATGGRRRPAYALRQGGSVTAVEPLTGERPVERFYDYRLPEGYEAPGALDADQGPYFQSVGTRALQRESTTITFVYDGPNGQSLVVVHDAPTGDGGGAASWTVAVRPTTARWRVRDDWYVSVEAGERPASNYDRWTRDEGIHRIDWTWSGTATDGGVLGYLTRRSLVHVRPAFDDAAALFGDHYAGDVSAWEFLSGDRDDPDRIPLAMDRPVTLVGPGGERPAAGRGGPPVGTAEGGGDGHPVPDDGRDPSRKRGENRGDGSDDGPAGGERGRGRGGRGPGRGPGSEPPWRGPGGPDEPPGRAKGRDRDRADDEDGDGDADDRG